MQHSLLYDRTVLYNVKVKRETKEKVLSASKTVLVTIGVLGFVVVAASMGNAVQLLKYTPFLKKNRLKVYEVNHNIKRLLSRGLIQIKKDKNYEYLELTEKGKSLLLKCELEGLNKSQPSKWDGKYRLVIFDISESSRRIRDDLRKIIRGFGFVYLQKSVWIYPYPCKDIIELLKKYLGIHGEVIYMEIGSIEDDEWLRKSFNLK